MIDFLARASAFSRSRIGALHCHTGQSRKVHSFQSRSLGRRPVLSLKASVTASCIRVCTPARFHRAPAELSLLVRRSTADMPPNLPPPSACTSFARCSIFLSAFGFTPASRAASSRPATVPSSLVAVSLLHQSANSTRLTLPSRVASISISSSASRACSAVNSRPRELQNSMTSFSSKYPLLSVSNS